ncbi:hypothetical protein GUJ93_ZPchr0012g20686 [Zizania palustris]|uniref:Uncharacterized protein n=1 Tax=Zizania palustris TaxID=103762 RepID=A0A8J6BSS9_ZIZPA|nr:hypothetical protein GUJ93_ZPchr0012g20686 [Zizania palustris]
MLPKISHVQVAFGLAVQHPTPYRLTTVASSRVPSCGGCDPSPSLRLVALGFASTACTHRTRLTSRTGWDPHARADPTASSKEPPPPRL